jgi:superoxide reductase
MNMAGIKDLFQSADWKKEKHVPVIGAPEAVKKGDAVTVSVAVGKEIAHPNTTEHHISWIEVYFHPDGEKFPCQIGRFDFLAHGASVNGPNTSTVFTQPDVTLSFRTEKPGTVIAASLCNIHGLWESAKAIRIS